jgi:hypothetical protein
MGLVEQRERTAWYLEAAPAAVSKWLVRLRRAAAIVDGVIVSSSIALPAGTFPLRRRDGDPRAADRRVARRGRVVSGESARDGRSLLVVDDDATFRTRGPSPC